jgi:cephalosporin hydroxylase
MKRYVQRLASIAAPKTTQRILEGRWLRQHAEEFATALRAEPSIGARVDLARAQTHFRSNQKRTEICSLLEILASTRPRRVCEIGADRGGTLALISSVSAPDARILSLDISYSKRAATLNQLLCAPRQLTCIEGDSHHAATYERVKAWLDGDQLDFLFIDGDHSYEGVKSDYETYGPLVRTGGLIAFHDIVEDYRTRFGQATVHDVGQVPAYWKELKSLVHGAEDIIEDAGQDGYGIGLLRVTG